MYVCLYNLKDFGISEERELLLPNKNTKQVIDIKEPIWL